MTGIPVWLLDVDGVINVTRPGWGAAPRQGYACADGSSWKFRWAPALVTRLRDLHCSGAAELRWCTSWSPQASQLERLFGLPELARANPSGEHEDKLPAALAVALDERRPLIWTDDDQIPSTGLYQQQLLDAGALLIRPSPRRGLQPADLDLITGWLAAKNGTPLYGPEGQVTAP